MSRFQRIIKFLSAISDAITWFLFHLLPFIIGLMVVLIFFSSLMQYAFTDASIIKDNYKVLFGGIGIVAVLSGLSFRASSSVSDDLERKRIYFSCGENMFYATLLIITATILQYYILHFAPLRSDPKTVGIAFYIREVRKFSVSVAYVCYFIYSAAGAYYAYIAFYDLYRMLRKNRRFP